MNIITDLDFDQIGEKVATIDKNGVVLLSEIDTDNYCFHLRTEGIPSHKSFIYIDSNIQKF